MSWPTTCLLVVGMLFAGSGRLLAQGDEKAARDLIEKAFAEISRDPNKGRLEAGRLLREALEMMRTAPTVSRERFAEISVMYSLFMLGEQRPAEAFRSHVEEAVRIYDNAKPAVDDSRMALALEVLASLSDTPSEQAEALRKRSTAIRQRLVTALRTQDEAADPWTASEHRRIGNGVSPPRPRERREPSYTEEARIGRRQGAAVLSIVVDAEGKPRNITLVRSLGFGLDEAAYQAVKTWKFEPATADGQPVAVTANVEVNFRLL